MKRTRNVLALLLCFALCLCLLPMAGADSYAGESVTAKLEAVLAEYPNGSTWTGSFDGGSQCYGFAKLVVYRLFGKFSDSTYRSWLYNGNSSSGMVKIDAVENCTSASVQSLLQKALPGDVLQFDTGNTSGHQHSMIVYSVTSNGAEIYECNWTKNTVTKTSLTSAQIANRQTRSDGTKRGTLSLLRSDNYPTVDSSVQAYLNQCTSTSCNVILTVTTAGNMKNMPCSVSTNAQSQTVETLTTGDKYTSTRRWSNTGGSHWYEVTSKSGQRGFIYAGDVSIDNTPSTMHVEGNEAGTPSGKLTKGASFGLRGIISSNYPIYSVEAHIYDSDPNGHDAIPAYRATGLNVTSYNIKDDGINNHFSFSSLPEGEYRYMVFARDTSMAASKILIDSHFTIGTVTYTISYNANGGTGAPSSQTKTYGTNLTLSSTKPTRANSNAGSYTVTLNANGGSVNTSSLSAARTTSYTFKNWNTAANGSGTNYNAGATYTPNASATLYAQWNSSTTTSVITLPTPTRTGYTFKGWSTSSTATSGITGSYTPTGNVTLYAAWEAITSIDSQNFPDEVFRNYVSENCDTDKDGYLSSTEIADVTVISVSGSAEKPGVITSLKGVEYFTELTELNCSYNQLTSLDLSKNTNLTYLACWNNRLTVLDVSNASALQALYCYNNQLTSLNLADNTALKYLICSDNKLASLILNCNITLQEVNCINNQLTSLSLINYTSLRYLYCQNNRLSLLDLHDDTALSGLFCSDNQLTELNVIGDSALRELNCTNNQLTTLNLNNVSVLQWLYCANNQIYNLNIMDNPNLACLYCFGNQLPYLDISSCKVLQECVKTGTQSFEDDGSRHYKLLDGKELATDNGLKLTGGASVVAISESSFPDPVFRSYISENCDVDQDTLLSEMEIATTVNITCEKVGIKDLTGVEFFTSLKALICSGNELRELNLSNNPDLAFLRCNDNNLNNLDVSACHGLVELTCHNNQLTDLNTNGCNIMFLRCDNNQLTNLDVSAMTQLFSLNCTHNQLTSLDVSNNASLYYLYCPYNNLTAIDVSHNPYLCEFTCHSNQLTELDISQNPALQWLSCSANELTNLDVQLNTALKTLYCENNSLSELNVDNLTSLELLNCANNNINALNVSKNTELQRLWCYNNHLTKLDTTNNPKLILLSCLGNQLTQLDISKNTALRGVACYRNQISTLNIKDCPLLIELTERMEPVISDGIINYVYDTSNNDFLWLTYDESTKLYCTLAPDFTLPAELKEIDEEAFTNCAFGYVHIPDGVTRIERRAFADCPNLHDVDIPASATSIDPTAFAGTSGLTIHGADGSYAEFYAGKYGFDFIPVA